MIRRKRKATEKFLKKDVADLLANGLDINAYGRVIARLFFLALHLCSSDLISESIEFLFFVWLLRKFLEKEEFKILNFEFIIRDREK